MQIKKVGNKKGHIYNNDYASMPPSIPAPAQRIAVVNRLLPRLMADWFIIKDKSKRIRK